MYHCANLEGWFPYPENKDCQPWGVVDREPEQREDLVAATLFLGFLPAHIFILYHFPISAYWLRAFWLFFLLSSYVGFLLYRFIKYSNCPSSFSFHFHLKLALSVRRKWERKLGLFMALPVASDLEIFSLKKLFKNNFNNALTRKQLVHDSNLVKILSILGRGGCIPSRLTLTADEMTRAATSFWSGEGWPAGQMGAESSPAKVVSI